MNKQLNNARKSKFDEYYTQLSDIEEELCHYNDVFRNKVVYCNCDNPDKSNFYKYFYIHFKSLGLRGLMATYKTDFPKLYTYDGKSTKIFTISSGDFRSTDCVNILQSADVVVTNPPFSLFREFVDLLLYHQKKFLIVGNINAITYKNIFSLFMFRNVWLGYRSLNKDMYFNIPEDVKVYLTQHKKENSAYRIIDGCVMGRLASACWFTNLDHNKRHQYLSTTCFYSADKYPKYDKYNIINVNKVKEIPMDYTGIMGVPITYLGVHNPEQFEILGIANSARYIGHCCLTVINGKKIYNRILIRKL